MNAVDGQWGDWMAVTVDHCRTDPNGTVKQIRYCDNPTPNFGGNLCPEPDTNERFIPCNVTNYEGIIFQISFKFSSCYKYD